MKKRKTQISVEFMIILIFMLVILGIVMGIIGYYIIGFNNQINQKKTDSLAKFILSQYNLMSKIQGGYYNKFLLFSNVNLKYNISIKENYLIINESSINKISYYEIPNSNSIYSINITTKGISTYIILQKKIIAKNSTITITTY